MEQNKNNCDYLINRMFLKKMLQKKITSINNRIICQNKQN